MGTRMLSGLCCVPGVGHGFLGARMHHEKSVTRREGVPFEKR